MMLGVGVNPCSKWNKTRAAERRQWVATQSLQAVRKVERINPALAAEGLGIDLIRVSLTVPSVGPVLTPDLIPSHSGPGIGAHFKELEPAENSPEALDTVPNLAAYRVPHRRQVTKVHVLS